MEDSVADAAYYCGHEDPERARPAEAFPSAVEFVLDGTESVVVRYVRASAGTAARFSHGGGKGPGGRVGWHLGSGPSPMAANDPSLSDYAWLAESATGGAVLGTKNLHLAATGSAASLAAGGKLWTYRKIDGCERYVCVEPWAERYAAAFASPSGPNAPVFGAPSDVPGLAGRVDFFRETAASVDLLWDELMSRKWEDPAHGA